MTPTDDSNRRRHFRTAPPADHVGCFPKTSVWIGLFCLLFAATGCNIIRTPANQTEKFLRSVSGKGGRQSTNQLSVLQNEVMRQADNYAAGVAQAADDLAQQVGTPEVRMEALQWKLQQATAAYMNATGENPPLNAVDMAVLSSLSAHVVEVYWIGKYGDAAKPLLEIHRKLEKNAWTFLEGILTPAQQAELHEVIEEWSRRNPSQRYVAALHLRDFSEILGKKGMAIRSSKPNSLFSMLNVDPLAGLDPAIVAIEQTRLLAERMMYYFERAPSLVSWQVELMTYRLANQPAPQQLMSNVTSLSQSAAIFAKTAEQLPALVNDQRQAAINQIFVGISNERSNILESLNSQEAKLRELLPEVRETLATAGNTGTSLDGAIKSLNEFVHYVSPPDTNPPVVSTNSQPFNILDYGKAAAEIGTMAKQLDVLLASANQSATQLAVISEHASGTAERVVDHAFWSGLWLIAFLLVGAVLAGLIYRALANKLSRRQPNPKTET